MTKSRVVVFDAYGTLLDVDSAMAKHAVRLGADWPRISAEWRRKQLEYSWIRSLTGPAHHRDFWRLTEEALAWTAARYHIEDASVLADVLLAYRHLDPYPEVPEVLQILRGREIPLAVLSNGTPDMLADATQAAGIDGLLDFIFSIETAGVFKPDPRVYGLVTDRLGLAAGEIAFVSSNPWDAFGALAFGFQVFWLNRSGLPAEYELRGAVTELTSLTDLPPSLS